MTLKIMATIPSVPVWCDREYFLFDRKFYDGACLYAEMWPGTVRCIMRVSERRQPDFGIVKKKKNDLPFQIVFKEGNKPIAKQDLKDASVVLASCDNYLNFNVASLCRKLNIKCFYNIEYIPETRYQIAKLQSKNIFRLLRRYIYVWSGERKRKNAMMLADGIQANGGPAYEYYKNICHDAIIYFDTRITKQNLASNVDISNRLKNDGPIRLAFSGRLTRIKGVDHLLLLCSLLDTKRIEYTMDFYGSGDLDEHIKKYIAENGLDNKVALKGVVDFKSELLPTIRSKIDLFVCLHRQSDPSCTYLETLSCGVPIAGYLNRAFSYILKHADVGWGSKLGDLNGVADIIEEISKNRFKLIEKSHNALNFASQHTFCNSFERRMNQLRHSVGLDAIKY